jgi:C4-dicarboxylate-specific signal transduction histidine kinase
VRRPDGTTSWTQWIDRAIFDASGKIMEFQSVGRDVTAERLAAEQLRQQQEELAHVARVSVMGEMVAAMGHEIGQPLHTISTFAAASRRALEGDSPDRVAKVVDWLGRMQEQVQRAVAIIHRLRDFTRATGNDRAVVSIDEIVNNSLELTAADLRRQQVDVDLNLAEGLPPIYVDAIQIEQVLVNLLRNAGEAMAENPASPRPLLVASCQANQQVQVSVRDEGYGVSDEEFPRLFETFFTTKPEGTGIGLAISRRIIEDHGGSLWATRNENRGMTFTFYLPTAEQSQQAEG